MKKKIAIITLPLRNYNYGGILQNYALQQYLINNFDAEVETIDYSIDSNIGFLGKIKILLHNRIYNGYCRFKKNTSKNLEDFINSRIKISEVFKSKKDVEVYLQRERFNALISGSDQVWRLDYSGAAYSMLFLHFTNLKEVKKISYAASFGYGQWKFHEKEAEIKDYLMEMDAVSVREIDGVRILRETFNLDAIQLIDPTLLLKKEHYLKLIADKIKKKNTDKKILYAYILDLNENKKKILQNITSKLGLELKIIELVAEQLHKINKYSYKGFIGLQSESLEDWLLSFYQADYVITDSFHGTVFSIIFEKSFVALGNEKRGMSRFSSLLSLTGFETYLSTDFDEQKIINLLKSNYDYISADIKIEQARQQAYRFLSTLFS